MQIRKVLKATFNKWYRWKFDTFIISCFTFNRKIGSLKREHQNNRSIILFKNNYNFTQELHSLWLFLLQIQPMHNIETWSKLHSAMNTFYDNPNNLISVGKLTFQGAKCCAALFQDSWQRAEILQLSDRLVQVCLNLLFSKTIFFCKSKFWTFLNCRVWELLCQILDPLIPVWR